MPQRVSADALGRLLSSSGPALVLHAANWCDCPEDCVQQALVDLAGLPRSPDHPVAWLFRRVRQRALNAGRDARRRRERESDAWKLRLAARSTEPGAPSGADLVEALNQLTAEDRELVTLRFWSGLTFAEIAEVIGVSKSAAHRRCEAALSQLRDQLDSPCESTPPKKTPSSGASATR